MLNDIIGNMNTERIGEDIGELIEALRTLGWKEQRPWPEFFAVFKPPSITYKDIEQRVVTNFLQYRANYIAISCGIFALRILFAPVLFLCIVLCATVSSYLILVLKGPILIGELKLDDKMRSIICAIGSFIFLGLCGALEHLLWGLILSVFVCITHMLFRPRSISSKANKVYEEVRLTTDIFGKRSTDEPSSDIDIENPCVDDMESEPSLSGSGTHSGATGGATSASMRRRKS